MESRSCCCSAWLREADAFLAAALVFIAGQKRAVFAAYFQSFEVFDELASDFHAPPETVDLKMTKSN